MPIKTYRPITPTLRFQTTLVRDEITQETPYKPLVVNKLRTGGRRNSGDLTIRHHGGGHKQKLRLIDFKREKYGVPGTVATIEYDPNRSSRIALISYADGEKRYILQPVGLKVGQKIMSGPDADILVGNALPLKNIPAGTRCITWSCGRARARRWCGLPGLERSAGGEGRRLRAAEAAFRRNAQGADRLHGHDWAGGEHGSRERLDRQGGAESVEGHSADQPRRHHESGGSSARRR